MPSSRTDSGLGRPQVRAGVWRRCSLGVYFVDDRPFTDSARVRAAVWAHGPNAAASGLAAAWWLDLTRYAPATVEITVPRNSHGRSHAGSRLRRRDLGDADVAERRGLRVTALPLTVVEAAVRGRDGMKLMDAALQRHVDLRRLWDAHLRNKGRHGSPAARRLLQAADDGARSAAERLLIQSTAGRPASRDGWPTIPLPDTRSTWRSRAPKMALRGRRSRVSQQRRRLQQRPRHQNAIALAGWQVLRFTWLDLTEYPDSASSPRFAGRFGALNRADRGRPRRNHLEDGARRVLGRVGVAGRRARRRPRRPRRPGRPPRR